MRGKMTKELLPWRQHFICNSWFVALKSTSSGDACHPMLPYLAMGANSALEDGAVFGRLLRYAIDHENIPQALDLYQKIRKKRGEAIARETFKQVTSTPVLGQSAAELD